MSNCFTCRTKGFNEIFFHGKLIDQFKRAETEYFFFSNCLEGLAVGHQRFAVQSFFRFSSFHFQLLWRPLSLCLCLCLCVCLYLFLSMPNLDLVRLQFTRTQVIVDQPLIGAVAGAGDGDGDGDGLRRTAIGSCRLVSDD